MLPPDPQISTEDLCAVDEGRRSISFNEIATCLEELSGRHRKLAIDLIVRAVIVERTEKQEQVAETKIQDQESKTRLKLVKA